MSVDRQVVECARIPSFSTFEERLHPYIYEQLSNINDVTINKINDNNLVVNTPGTRSGKPVVITSHLDKINHFGSNHPNVLDVTVESGRIMGQMDDATGVGICIELIKTWRNNNFPPLYALFSEMEESMGLREHPQLLKNEGKDVAPQIGAKRLCAHLEACEINPALFVTIDTTPIFKGEAGVALYTEYWKKTGIMPDSVLLGKIEHVKEFILAQDSEVCLANGTNDYLVYGNYFGIPEKGNIPSIALEPAIFPYHQIGEGVFIDDIHRVMTILKGLLNDFDFDLICH